MFGMLAKSDDKIQEICNILRKDTLEPAQKEAARIIQEAEELAKKIQHEAHLSAHEWVEQAKKQMQQERSVFDSNLQQASKQALEGLRQKITQELFQPEVVRLIEEKAGSIEVVEQLISAIVASIENNKELIAYIPEHLKPQDVNLILAKRVLERLKGGSVEIGGFKGGAKVKVEGENLTLDISDVALKELLLTYLKKPEFRQLIFNV